VNGGVVVDIKYYNISVITPGGGGGSAETTAANGSRARSIVRAEDI